MNKFNVVNKAKFTDLFMLPVGTFAVNFSGVIFQRTPTGALKWINSSTPPTELGVDSTRGNMVQACDADIRLTPKES